MIGSTPKFSVSDFVSIFNQSVELMYPEVVITGELSNFRVSKNVWVYCDLKDDDASVRFFGTIRELPSPVEDGMMLEISGRPYLHPKFGFSVQINTVKVVGSGAINKAYELLKKKLTAEGLFDDARKRMLPYAPKKIGLIASTESAAYGDFIKVSKNRWPLVKIERFNVNVQGRDAPGQIIKAIEDANRLSDIEALVIVRGGGSRDDLSAFDHEQVVRAVSSSRLVTLVAIGHERDIALCELAADVRASTPSNAAEMLLPDMREEKNWLRSVSSHLDSIIAGYNKQISQEVMIYHQSFDQGLYERFTEVLEHLTLTRKLLTAYDPNGPLDRGYAIVKASNDTLIRSATEAREKQRFSVQFKDDKVEVSTEE